MRCKITDRAVYDNLNPPGESNPYMVIIEIITIFKGGGTPVVIASPISYLSIIMEEIIIPQSPASETSANFENADLSRAKLSAMNFSGANFNGALLIGADLSYADLSNAQFVCANLRDANLQNATLTNANFKKADLQGATLQNTSLSVTTSETIKTPEQLQKMAFYDPVTDVYNRQAFEEFFQKALQDGRRYEYGSALFFIDLDHFKAVNDTQGHLIGDAVLKEAATRLQKIIRQGDLVARLGGDEFAIYFKNIHSEIVPGQIAEKLLTLLNAPYLLNKITITISASIGICYWQSNSQLSMQDILSRADIALYRVKERGRNGYQYYSKFLHRKHEEHAKLKKCVATIIEHGEIALQYKPIACLTSLDILGFEAKMCCQVGEKSLDSEQITELIQETELVTALEKKLLQDSFSHIADWNKRYRSAQDSLQLYLTLSPIYLSHVDFFEVLDELLKNRCIAPNKISIELPEAQFQTENDTLLHLLLKLRQKNINIVLKHFTSETIPFLKLKKLPISKIKIASHLIQGLTEDRHKQILVRSIIQFAHQVNMFCIADGVEHEWQAKQLSHFACDAIQGDYVGHLLSHEEVNTFFNATQNR